MSKTVFVESADWWKIADVIQTCFLNKDFAAI